MPDIKLASKITKPISRILERFEGRLAGLDKNIIAIVEFTTVKRVDVSIEADAAPAVYLQITSMEIAVPEQESHLRRAMQAMFRLRTARGTLDELPSTEDANAQLRLLGDQILVGED
jgi:hypothetical protein